MKDDRSAWRLAAILVADVAGYSRLMTLDGPRSPALDAARTTFRSAIEANAGGPRGRHGGRLGVVGLRDRSLRCQCGARGPGNGSNRRPQPCPLPSGACAFAWAFHLGDVIEKGDGARVWRRGRTSGARLEALAGSGRRRGTYDAVCAAPCATGGLASASSTTRGQHQVKNIAGAVRAFRVRAGRHRLSKRRKPRPVPPSSASGRRRDLCRRANPAPPAPLSAASPNSPR